MEAYMDRDLAPEQRAEDLLSKLSLPEKMAQIRGVFAMGYPGDDSPEWFRGRGIGQISALRLQMMPTSLEDAMDWLHTMQEQVIRESPHGIPAIFHMEGLCGSYLHGCANYPSGVNRGASFDPTLEEEIGHHVARDELSAGITQVLAPVLDVSRDPRMGRCGESYGEDPALVSAMGSAYARAIQSVEEGGRRAASTAKHFVGFHSSRGGIHGGGASIGYRELLETYARSFQAATSEAGLKGIMPCYNTLDGNAFSASKAYLTDLLRDQMGFTGVTVSDYGAVSQVHEVKKVGETLAEAGAMCLNAGMDVELPQPVGYGNDLEQTFENGSLPVGILDRAVLRILAEKFRMGLFENPYGRIEAVKAALQAEKESSTARRAAEESIILLKNNGLLPLSSPSQYRKVLVVGPHAANARFYFGGYTHLSMMESMASRLNTLAGVGQKEQIEETARNYPGTQVQIDDDPAFSSLMDWIDPSCSTLLQELKDRFPEWEIEWSYGYPIIGEDRSGYEEALAKASGADLVILTLGGKYGTGSIATMGEGIDSTDINLPACQDGLIEAMKKLGKPLVGIHFGGRPISSDIADRDLDAILEAFCPAAYTAPVLVDILQGRLNPSGKLPVSIAYNAGQIPVVYSVENGSGWHQAESIGFPDYIDRPHRPRYPFGFGLSYTKFEYSDLGISADEVDPDGSVTISFRLSNVGDRAGTEIVQLYIVDEYASVVRPAQELAGFGRVSLEPGEEKTVTFTLQPSQTAFLDADLRWKIEKGRILIQAGAASNDIRLEGAFRITEDRWIDGKHRAFYTLAEKI